MRKRRVGSSKTAGRRYGDTGRRRSAASMGRIIGHSSLGLLSLLTLALLLPSVKKESQALDCEEGEEACYTTMASTELAITTNTAISLAMSPSVTMEVVPTSTGATSSASTKLAVSTNSKDGYALYMQTGNSTGDLLSTSTTNTISKISNTTLTNTSLEGLEKNTYGYAISTTAPDSNTKYSPLPTTGGVIQKTDSTTGSNGDNYIYGDTYYLAFGTKVGTDLEAGSYTGTVTVSAVANPKTLASMFDLTYMQEMSSDICTNTREGYTKQLIDTRDGKSYWVAKLKDGNCWMVQNLALDITEEGLKAVDTDIEEDWNQESEYPPRRTVTADEYLKIDMAPTQYTTYSWNLGEYVNAVPLYPRDANTTIINSLDKMAMVDFVDVSANESFTPDYMAQDGVYILYNGEKYNGLIALDIKAKKYDSHYLLGNHYQYNTATAGAVSDSASKTNKSICPKGWKLPNESTTTDSGVKGMSNLFKSYGNSYNTIVGNEFYAAQSGYVNVGKDNPSYEKGIVSLVSVNSYFLNGELRFNVSDILMQSTSVVNRGTVSADYSLNIINGGAVRCVAR